MNCPISEAKREGAEGWVITGSLSSSLSPGAGKFAHSTSEGRAALYSLVMLGIKEQLIALGDHLVGWSLLLGTASAFLGEEIKAVLIDEGYRY